MSNKRSTDPVYNTTNGYNYSNIVIDEAVTFDEIGQMMWIIPQKKCECGAKYTSRPNYHLDWCPLYEKK
jgi:hypothetical protein